MAIIKTTFRLNASVMEKLAEIQEFQQNKTQVGAIEEIINSQHAIIKRIKAESETITHKELLCMGYVKTGIYSKIK